MSDLEQVPFGGVEFASNPESRCACLLLLDTSGSMSGAKIAQLNAGLQTFSEQLRADAMTAKRVEVAIVTFGPVQTVQPFVTADSFAAPTLIANGDTPMGEAIRCALTMVAERKAAYKANGVGYYRPWIFMITDGDPTDDVSTASAAVKEAETAKAVLFYAVAVDGANVDRLSSICVRTPLMLKGLSFRELFVWLSNSLGSVSRSQVGEQVPLASPAGWAVID